MPYLGKEPARVPVTAADIPDDSITAAKIVDGVITAADIGPNAVNTSELVDDAVTADKLANSINTAIAANTAKTGITTSQTNAITANTAKVTNATHTGDVTGATALTIAADAVTGAKIADDSIDSEHIVDGSIDTAHIGANQVTSAKLESNITVAGDLTVDTSTLKVDSSNNRVGIGTASPAQLLSIVDSGSARMELISGTSGTSIIDMGDSDDKDIGGIRYAQGTNAMQFRANNDVRMEIRSDGKMSIGGAAYASSAFSHVNFPASGINIINADTNGHFRAIYQSSDQNTYFTNGSVQAYLSSSGAWTNASDIAYKKDITDATYGIDAVKDMKPRFYYMKDESIEDTTRNIGFIAQELETVVPEVVSGDDGSKGVNYGHLTAVLTKALQEAITEIETLKTKVAALESE